MSASHFCCTHPQQRIDSPEPPARPLASIDGIFAAAALPDDHPHALRFPDRKPDTDPSIVKSPGIASKLKSQFRRKSMKHLGKDKEYDGDAHRITSQEVLEEVKEDSPTEANHNDVAYQHRFGSVADLRSTKSPDSDASTPQIRASVLGSLEYLRPLLQKPSNWTTSGASKGVTHIAVRNATRQHLLTTSSENERPLPPLPKSFSTPLLPSDEPAIPLQPRRSRSDCELRDNLSIPKLRNSMPSGGLAVGLLAKPSADSKAVVGLTEVPKLHVQEATDIESLEAQDTCQLDCNQSGPPTRDQTPSDNGVHLHRMDISQQLRCMSQLSDVAEDETPAISPRPWNFHFRERSDLEASGRSRHSRQKSSTGIDSTTLPSSWGRVRSPLRDTSSSIYSRPTSPGINVMDQHGAIQSLGKAVSPIDLHDLFADWPLKPSQSTEETNRRLSTISRKSAGSEHRNKPLPPTPGGSRQESGTASFVMATNKDDGSSVKWLSPPQRPSSIKSGSSISTKASKHSKFHERFSPPKKFVTKRRSIFKFLRPGSRKQGRSISTPTLSVKSPGRARAFDGPSDDPALLTVQYELPDQPNNAVRSMSMSLLGQSQDTEATNQLAVPHQLQRRPTLAEFERNLSVAGDDRRRPSVINVHRAQEIQQEDRRESITLKRRLSRAHALKDDASPLMAQALEKHQQEKALFRSASKQRESLKSSYPTPVFSSSPFTHDEAKDEHGAHLDHSQQHTGASSFVSSYSGGLAVPQQHTANSSRRASMIAEEVSPSTRPSRVKVALPTSPPQKPRIRTSLDSWSRYPSHTRADRCGSAGKPDAVITRDFAVGINPVELQVTDEIEPGSPASSRSTPSQAKKAKAPLPKTRSMTFSSIVRYYSNLFHTSGFTGQNRRTSVSTGGGKLDHPELEMLPHSPAEGKTHHHSHYDPFEKFKEHMKEDADMIKEYVAEEEDKIGGFVKKEEQKLMKYIKEEEDKLMHHHRHHSSDHNSSGRHSPFHEVSVFGASHEHEHDHTKRRDTMIEPMDDIAGPVPQIQVNDKADIGLALDGAAPNAIEEEAKPPSKADLWSGIYQECMVESSIQSNLAAEEAEKQPLMADTTSMPPPALKPVKPRSPEQPRQVDSNATIRRFPSVTVIDDQKGHFRSISLVSVKTNRSTKFERSSTHDLLEMIQAREREERDKLLKSITNEMTIEVVDVN